MVVNLIDRGQQILRKIDLYDENQLGAGQLTYTGSYEKMEELMAAINKVLENSPIEEEGKASSPLSVNRFHSNNNWGKRDFVLGDLFPLKSRYLVHFLLNFDFGNDFCLIDLGINWAPLFLSSGQLNPQYPLGEHNIGDKIKLSDLKILKTTMCTLDDAVELLKDFNLSDPKNLEVTDLTQGISNEQLEAINLPENKAVVTIKINGEDVILVNGTDILSADIE